ncbi:MAG: AAA family ATPase [Pirellulales bacterium]
MYEALFDLAARPFVAACLVDRYFPAAAIDSARQTLVRCVRRSEGLGLVIAPAGTGKTLLCRVLAEEFRESLSVAMVAGASVPSPRALYQAILYSLGQAYRGMDDGELRISLEEHLASRTAASSGLLLLVDDAHALPVRVWEELRQLTDSAPDGRALVHLLAFGAPRLEERFTSPKLESLNQRVAVRAFLTRWNQQETIGFVRQQIEAAAGKIDRVFTPDALEALHRVTDGVPRLVIQVCDHSLILALAAQKRPIDGAGIAEAWADLEALPQPRLEQTPVVSGFDGVVEFGKLTDPVPDEVATFPFRAPAAETAELVAVNDDSADDQTEDYEPAPAAQTEAPRVQFRPAPEDDMMRWYDNPLDPELSRAAIWPIEAGTSTDFEPAAESGTEVELRFDDTSDPFDESFQHEEVLVDHYAGLETPAEATREPAAAEAQPVEPQWEWACTVQEIQPGEPTARRVATAPAASVPWAGGEEQSQAPHLSVLRESFDPTVSVAAVVSEDSAFVPAATGAPAETLPPAKPAASRGRRAEYRQLFTRLRQGPA